MDKASTTFDFDEWKKLFETNPDAFEARRRELIERAIQRAPQEARQRLRGLQWKVDATRRRYKHPQVSSAKLFQMMWDQVYGENGLLDALTAPCIQTSDVDTQGLRAEKVVQLRQRKFKEKQHSRPRNADRD